MSLLALILSLTAQAAPIHDVKLEKSLYAGRPSSIAGNLESDLVAKIVETCGPTTLVRIHKHELRIIPLGDHKNGMDAVVNADKSLLGIIAYPQGVLEASFECL